MSSLRVVFAGTPEVAVPTLLALRASQHQVVAVLSKPDAPAGRGKKLTPSAVSQTALEEGIALLRPESLESIGEDLSSFAPDVVAVVAYGKLIPESALTAPALGWINAHFSLLPAWRGAAPVQRAIAAGDESIGVTTFRIDSGLDTGPILLRTPAITIEEREDSGALLQRLAPIGADLMVRTLDALADGSIEAVPQSELGASTAPQITTNDARVDWRQTAVQIDRWIRACTPVPGAWTTVNDQRLRLGTPRAVEESADAVPGRFVIDRRSVRVGTGAGYLVLGEVRPHGRASMSADAWARGLRGEVPDAI